MTTIHNLYETESEIHVVNEEYAILCERMDSMQEVIRLLVGPENMDKVLDFVNLIHQVIDYEKEALFTKGFSLGQCLAMEALNNCRKKDYEEI